MQTTIHPFMQTTKAVLVQKHCNSGSDTYSRVDTAFMHPPLHVVSTQTTVMQKHPACAPVHYAKSAGQDEHWDLARLRKPHHTLENLTHSGGFTE